MTRFIGVVCGLKSEAAVAREAFLSARFDGVELALGVSGADAARAEKIASEFAGDGAAAIFSIGVSGGLDPALSPGDLLLATSVVTEGGEKFAADEKLLRALHSAHPGESRDERGNGARDDSAQPRALKSATLFGADRIIVSPEEKAWLFASTGAAAVDMESHGAARAASKAGVPFSAIRAIADPASRALPNAALGAVAPDGSTRVISTLLKCAKAPGDFPALVQLGRDSDLALKALRRDLGGLFRSLLLGLDL